VPERTVGDQVVLARPGGGSALVLGPTAAVVWMAREEWLVHDQLEAALAAQYPDIPPADRDAALEEILRMLDDEALLERRAP
jgi:hypothetical protein